MLLSEHSHLCELELGELGGEDGDDKEFSVWQKASAWVTDSKISY